MLRAALLLINAALAAACAPVPPASAARELPRIGVFERFETMFDLSHAGVHPDDVAIRARFRAPSGRTVVIGGFAYDDAFRVRFTPVEEGVHRYDIEADGGRGFERVAAGELEAVPSEAAGFVRVDPVDTTRLLHDDGTPFVVLGENRINVYDPTWNYGELGIRDYVAYMASFGMTTLRVFVFSDCEHEESATREQLGCIEPAVGRFDERAAARFDEVLAAAEDHGVHVILTLYAIGFTPDETWKSWEDNPYNVANGGPAATPEAFFEDGRVLPHAERRLRYALDRWGYSPNLLALDLLNEPEWDGNVGEDTWRPWAEHLAEVARRYDPYDHLITAGPVGLHWNAEGNEWAWYLSPGNDVVQWHLYGEATYDPHAHALEMTRKVDETLSARKPVLCGEFAYGGEDKTTYDHTHTGIWAAAFSGAGALAHSAPPFNVDSDEPMTPERAEHFRVLRELLASLDWDRPLRPRHYLRASPSDLRVWELGAPDYRVLWLLAPPRDYGQPVAGATVTLRSLAPGEYAVEWLDDTSGRLVDAARLVHDGGDVTLVIPRFTRHLAARIVPTAPARPPRA